MIELRQHRQIAIDFGYRNLMAIKKGQRVVAFILNLGIKTQNNPRNVKY